MIIVTYNSLGLATKRSHNLMMKKKKQNCMSRIYTVSQKKLCKILSIRTSSNFCKF